MKAFKAVCVEAGGGYVRLMVGRDTQEYPGDGERVVVVALTEFEDLENDAALWRAAAP